MLSVSAPNVTRQDAGGMSEFFRYHGMWSPGVRLFRQVGFGAKALIITAVFAIPIILLAWSYYTDKATVVGFSAKERVGIVYGREVSALIHQLQARRSASSLHAAGKALGQTDADSFDSGIRQQMEKVAAVEKTLGRELGTQAAYAKLAQLVGNGTAARGENFERTFEAQSAQLVAALDLLSASTDGSNLTLDPDIDSYYLMDAAYFRLPQTIEAVGQLKALGALSMQTGAVTPQHQRRMIEEAAVVASHLSAMEGGLAKSAAYNAEVKASQDAREPLQAARHLLATLDQAVLQGTQSAARPDPQAFATSADAALHALFTLNTQVTDQLDQLVDKRVRAMETGRDITSVVLVLSLVLVTYLFIAFRKVLDGGLKEVAFHINAMRDGDLTTTPRPWGADEAAGLMCSLADMQRSLRGIVNDVRGASDSIVHSSAEIAVGSTDLSARTEQAAANLEESASVMEELSATVKHTAGVVTQAASIAHENAGVAERGGDIIATMVATMDEIQGSSRRIGDIVGTIDSIAFQTSILALNAAVEAARAGESGRGFAVVATEVRQLAQRSATAAREIKGLIGTSVEKVSSGTVVVKSAGDTMGEIVVQARRINALLAEIAQGAREQAAGVQQATQTVQDMDTATQQNAALVEQTAAAAASMKSQADALAAGVAAFKLG